MDLVTRAIEEARVDEHDTLTHSTDAFGKVDCRAAFFIHYANLDRIGLELEHVFNSSEQRVGKRDLVGAVHLRFDDIDATGATVGLHALATAVGHRASRRDDRVENTLEYLIPLLVKNCIGGHQVPDVAHQHQAAARQRKRLASW